MGRISTGAGSKQDYQTPKELVAPVQKRFGKIVFDLAAGPKNKQHKRYFAAAIEMIPVRDARGNIKKGPDGKHLYRAKKNVDPQAEALDALAQSWHKIPRTKGGLLWLNPPFKIIAPWAAKCLVEARLGAHIAFLVPAAVGSIWFVNYVWKKADIYYLHGRLAFTDDPYTKDCMVVHFWPGMRGREHVWDWRRNALIDGKKLIEASGKKLLGEAA